MSDHLNIERISALLEDPAGDPEGSRHLAECEACQAEHERLGRMRMALSGLPDLRPPAGQWDRIAARLEAGAGPEVRTAGPWGGRSSGRGPLPSWALQLAAAVVLFGGGIFAGLRLTAGPGSADDPGGVAATGEGATNPTAAYGAFDGLERPLPMARMGDGSGMDPVAAAERLARLDALIAASREAVTASPADPVANDLLFELVEQREALAGRLQQTLHLATLEVR